MPQTERIVEADNNAISNIFGQFDANISKIEREMSVKLSTGVKALKLLERKKTAGRLNRL